MVEHCKWSHSNAGCQLMSINISNEYQCLMLQYKFISFHCSLFDQSLLGQRSRKKNMHLVFRDLISLVSPSSTVHSNRCVVRAFLPSINPLRSLKSHSNSWISNSNQSCVLNRWTIRRALFHILLTFPLSICPLMFIYCSYRMRNCQFISIYQYPSKRHRIFDIACQIYSSNSRDYVNVHWLSVL